MGIWNQMAQGNGFMRSLHRSVGKTYFEKPGLNTMTPFDSNRGIDIGSRAAGGTQLATGVPTNPRHRRYFAITPPGAGGH